MIKWSSFPNFIQDWWMQGAKKNALHPILEGFTSSCLECDLPVLIHSDGWCRKLLHVAIWKTVYSKTSILHMLHAIIWLCLDAFRMRFPQCSLSLSGWFPDDSHPRCVDGLLSFFTPHSRKQVIHWLSRLFTWDGVLILSNDPMGYLCLHWISNLTWWMSTNSQPRWLLPPVEEYTSKNRSISDDSSMAMHYSVHVYILYLLYMILYVVSLNI